jgi:hypothetical protein
MSLVTGGSSWRGELAQRADSPSPSCLLSRSGGAGSPSA